MRALTQSHKLSTVLGMLLGIGGLVAPGHGLANFHNPPVDPSVSFPWDPTGTDVDDNSHTAPLSTLASFQPNIGGLDLTGYTGTAAPGLDPDLVLDVMNEHLNFNLPAGVGRLTMTWFTADGSTVTQSGCSFKCVELLNMSGNPLPTPDTISRWNTNTLQNVGGFLRLVFRADSVDYIQSEVHGFRLMDSAGNSAELAQMWTYSTGPLLVRNELIEVGTWPMSQPKAFSAVLSGLVLLGGLGLGVLARCRWRQMNVVAIRLLARSRYG